MQASTRKARLTLLGNLAIAGIQFKALYAKDFDTWRRCEDKLAERRARDAQANSRLPAQRT